MDEDKLLERLSELLADMAFDYDRFSESGKQTYDEMCSVMNQLLGG